MRTKLTVGGIILFLIAIGLYFYIVSNGINLSQQSNSQATPTRVQMLTVTQQIEDKKEQLTAPEGGTALELLAQSQIIETKGEGKDAFIVSINGRKASDEKKEFWAFYVNGKQAEVGAGSYKLKNGDTILWKIETY